MSTEVFDPLNAADMEPQIEEMLDRKQNAVATAGPYGIATVQSVTGGLAAFLKSAVPGAVVSEVSRMGGGASKEQFVFTLRREDGAVSRHVLRMDPLQTVVETDRQREFELLRAFKGTVPVPDAQWIDAKGETFGRPFAIIGFVGGVTKPTDLVNTSASGFQTILGEKWRGILSSQFVDILATIHGFDWRSADLPSFTAPDEDPSQAALWQVNWWSRVWRDDRVVAAPLIAAVEGWLRENLPQAQELVVVHEDYRTGNYLFDEQSEKITAILDWELAHLGDFHEDLGCIIQRLFSTNEDGQSFVTGLMTREDLIARYERASGRTVNPRTLHFYEVLSMYRSVINTFATSVRAAEMAHSHQDILLSWIASCGHVLANELCDLIEKEPTA
jgi:aminoglycoside phosphotransferase (APT) family kinase protein